MSGGTISTSETRIEALQLQSSAYGVTMAVVWGVNQISGNLCWYGGFKATPHTTTQSAGGKGGGVKTQNTTYTYSASVVLGLCEGTITGVPRIWRGKKLYSGGWLPAQINTATESYAVPASGPMTYTVAHAATYVGVVSLRVSGRGETFAQGWDYTLSSAGVLTILNTQMRGYTVQIRYQWTSGAQPVTALEQLGLSFKAGSLGQPVWSYLSSTYPAEALGYSGLALVTGQDYDLGTGAQVENHLFEVQGRSAYHLGPTVPDVDPATAMFDLLTNAQFGAGVPASFVDGSNAWSDYCVSGGLLLSPALTEQASAAEVLKRAADTTNTAIVWSGNTIKLVPYGDTAQTGNGVTYTPNVTPIYDLADGDFLNKEQPVRPVRSAPSDAFNHVRVEFLNRGAWDSSTNSYTGNYAPEIAEAKDQASIDTQGLRTMPTVTAHWICDPVVARLVAQLILNRKLYIRSAYEFELGMTKALLEPMDLVTLTDPGLLLDKLPVRITAIEENADGDMKVTAEDFPLGVAASTLYPSQTSGGFQANYNANPGNVSTPVFFEAPVELTGTGLEVYAAVKGASATWGGCRAWVSLDGTNYKQVATIYGPARYGQLTGPIASGNLPVTTSGQLISGSAADAAARNTLCYIGGSSPEYLSYQTATLTGAGAYTLSGLVRAAYGTSQVSAHVAGDAFVRVDEAVAKSGDLELSFIGKTIQFKFTSFNLYGAAEQSLADVSAYSYAITGVMASLPPATPTGGGFALEPYGLRFVCAKNAEPDVVAYEWRQGAVWSSSTVLEQNGGTSYLLAVQNAGTFSVMVAARDALGVYSPPLLITATIGAPSVGSFVPSISGTNLLLTWTGVAAAFAISGYEVRFGSSWASGTFVQFVQSNKYSEIVKWGGTRTYWVAAVDARGNVGTPVSVVVTINSPGAVGGTRADVVDNNALLYWTAPTTGDLPVDRYEVRKGASWAAGTVVGSNGNSTFTAIFEQQAGTYMYWVTAFDSAGNSGTPASIQATINQPPDYILRNDYNSAFPGTLTNMYLEAGNMIGPVDVTQTWATHFSSRGWSSPADQVAAGYPLYIEPSVTSGSYEEVIDYGAVLPATVVTATLMSTVLAGAVTVTCTLSYKTAAGDPWTVATAGVTSVFAPSGFRYVRVRYDFACTAGANVIQISGLNVKVANKLKTDSGTFAVTNAAVGVFVPFNVAFLDADTPLVQPGGTTPLVPVVDFSDVPNPTGFTVYLYNQSGVKVTGSGSWTARGY
jgi:hypothetical protein